MPPGSVVRFVLIAFAISYLVGAPLMMLASGAMPRESGLLRIYVPRILVVWGPALAALVVAARSRRDGGASALLGRLLPRRDDVLVAAGVVLVTACASAAALLGAGIGADELQAAVRAHPWLLGGHFVLQLAIVSAGEELGWRGWLLPELAHRMSRLQATAITAAIWTLWHAPLLLGGFSSAAIVVLGVFGLSVLFAPLVFHARRRILPVVFAHAAVNTPFFFLEQAGLGDVGPDARLLRAWAITQMVYAAAAVLVIGARWSWWTARDGMSK